MNLERDAVPDNESASAKSEIDKQIHYAAVHELFRDHNRALVNFLRARLPSQQEAVDVAQEAYVRLLQLDNPQTIGFLRGYLFKIAANLSADRIRRPTPVSSATGQVFEEIGDSQEMELQAITRQEFERAWQALSELRQQQREAFTLRFIEGYSTSEIAQSMGIDERTVRKHLSRALAHCRVRMNSDAPGTENDR